MAREVAYVLLTRTRTRNWNRAFVSTDRAVEPLAGFEDEPLTGRSWLAAV